MVTGLEAIIDWLEFTIKEKEVSYIITQILEMNVEDFTELERGRYGYLKMLQNGNISVLYEGREGMGVHVSLSGKGCREYETKNSIIYLMARIFAINGTVTRVDLALDDLTGKIIQFDKIRLDIKKGNVVSKWKSSIEIVKRSLQNGEIEGKTLNVGSRTSDVFLRIYDKSMEQKELEGKHTRLELEIKKKKAGKLSLILIKSSSIGILISKILNNYIRIVEPSVKDSNKSRWITKKYWSDMLATTEKVSLTIKGAERNVDDVKLWIEKQVAPSLALVMLDEGGDIDELLSIIEKGIKRMKPKHLVMLKRGKNNGK